MPCTLIEERMTKWTIFLDFKTSWRRDCCPNECMNIWLRRKGWVSGFGTFQRMPSSSFIQSIFISISWIFFSLSSWWHRINEYEFVSSPSCVDRSDFVWDSSCINMCVGIFTWCFIQGATAHPLQKYLLSNWYLLSFVFGLLTMRAVLCRVLFCGIECFRYIYKSTYGTVPLANHIW